jgi:hypothetical protein
VRPTRHSELNEAVQVTNPDGYLCVAGMWSNKAYTAMFFNTNAKSWAVVYYGFFSFGVNCVAFGIAIFTYWICVYKPEMAEKDTQRLLQKQAPVESQLNPRRRPGLISSIGESIDYRAWTSDDYRRANPPPENYMSGHGAPQCRAFSASACTAYQPGVHLPK